MSDILGDAKEWLRPLSSRQDPETRLIRALAEELEATRCRVETLKELVRATEAKQC